MDIVIPLGSGSKHNNLELRYTLRSIEKHILIPLCQEPGQIFLVGDRPDFIHNVIHIQAYDTPESKWKEQNIFQKVMAAIDDPRLSDDFILFNDEHFLLEPFTGTYYDQGFLKDSLASRTLHESYANTIRNTLRMYPEGLDFDVHCPMVMNKGLFRACVAQAEWHLPFGFSIQSLYGNGCVKGGDYHSDCKIRLPFSSEKILAMIKNWAFFSIGDEALNKEMELVLSELYPHKSVYEL